MFDRCVELGSVVIEVFRISLSVGSVGEGEEGVDSGGSPADTKVCCNSCKGDCRGVKVNKFRVLGGFWVHF